MKLIFTTSLCRYFFRDCSEDQLDDDVLARLTNMRNVIISSHQAFLTQEALRGIANTTITNMMEFFLDKRSMQDLTNHVAPPEISAALAKALLRKGSQSGTASHRRGSRDVAFFTS